MMLRHEHTQSEGSKLWRVVHNLVTRCPVMDTFIEIEGSLHKVMPNKVVVIDHNTVEIHWTRPLTGKVGVI